MGVDPSPGLILPKAGSPSYSDPQQPSMGIGRFRHDLYRGLGSALLELGRGERPELVPVVRRACLTLTSYDPQCEGGRGWYLHQAAILTGQGDSIEAEVRERFAHCRPDGWLFSQLEGIVLEFACEGSSPARDALWARYASLNHQLFRTVRRGGWWSQSSLLEGLALDLIDLESRLGSDDWGVATAMICGFGEAFMAYRPGSGYERWAYFPDWFDSGVGERFSERVGEYLNDPSPEVVAYAQTRDEARYDHTESVGTSPAATVENLKAMVRDGANVLQIRGMAMRVAQSKKQDTEALAHFALEQSDPDCQVAILRAFRWRPFPLPDDSLAPLVDSDNDRLREIVRIILGQRPAEWKREHALDLLRQGQQVNEALKLLQASYRAEDEPIVDAAIRKVSLRGDDWHSTFMAVHDLFSPPGRVVTTGVLSYGYRQTRCSGCRSNLVELMADKLVLTDDLVEECLWDSYDETREFARNRTKARDLERQASLT